MRVIIRLFARLREIAGASELTRETPAGADVRTVWDLLTAEFPALASYSGSIACAVNADYAPMNASLADGDEVAFLPPVSGGQT